MLPKPEDTEIELEPPIHELEVCDKFDNEHFFCGLEDKLTQCGLMNEPGFVHTFQQFERKFPPSPDSYKSPVHYFKPWYMMGQNYYQGEVDRKGIQEGRTI